MYQRRRQLPALILIGSLTLLVIMVWGRVFSGGADSAEAVKCAPALSGRVPGRAVPPDALDETDPVAPSMIKMTVFNGGGSRGKALLAAEELMSLGFNKANEPGNDPFYDQRDLSCHGQIRFGEGGASAARTLSIVVPCAELVRDDRQDATVDLAIGEKFEDIKPGGKAKRVMDALGQAGNAEVAGETAPDIAADLSRESIDKARQVRC